MNRDFKGIWIPREIWLNKDLSALEKVFLAEIASLDNGGCYASNEYFSEFLGVGVATICRMLKHLKELGFVEQYSFNGRTRVLKTLNLISLPYQNDKSDLSKCETDNIIYNKENDIYNNTYNNSLGSKDNNSNLKTTTKDCSNLKSLEDNIYNNIKSNDKLKEREKTNKREKEKIEDDITEIIEYLNLKAGKNYRTNVESNRSAIRARLNDHYTKEDCIKVIDIKVAKWKGTEYEQYLKVSTLFRPAHFDDYLNESEMLPFEEKKKNDTPEVNQEWRDMWSRA